MRRRADDKPTIEPSRYALELDGAGEIAAFIGRGERQTRHMIHQGIIPVVKIGTGKNTRIFGHRERIEQALQAMHEATAKPAPPPEPKPAPRRRRQGVSR